MVERHIGGFPNDPTTQNDATLTLLDRGTLYDVFCPGSSEIHHSPRGGFGDVTVERPEKKGPQTVGCLGCFGGLKIPPSYIGIIINHYKDPY